MQNKIVLAVAGSGKTNAIATQVSAQSPGASSLALTFTVDAQRELESRIPNTFVGNHETQGWYSFLVQHIVRPYFPAVFYGIVPHRLQFVSSDRDIPKYRNGWKYYLNDDHEPYSNRLGLLAKKTLEKTDNAPIRRLERIYDNIYIDEFQDLVGNDLKILEKLLKSTIKVFIVGDPRQAILATSSRDTLHRDYKGVHIVKWARHQEESGNCIVEENNVTTRYNQAIAVFSDLVHDPALQLADTKSNQTATTGHDGVFLVDEEDLFSYMSNFPVAPTMLWSRRSSREIPEGEIRTFGKAKGITRDRVVIFATKPILDLLKKRKILQPKSASGFYVAVTRARFSVALVVKNARSVRDKLHPDFQEKIFLWEPV